MEWELSETEINRLHRRIATQSDGMSLSELARRSGVTRFQKAPASVRRAVLDAMVDKGLLRRREVFETGGRPADRYESIREPAPVKREPAVRVIWEGE